MRAPSIAGFIALVLVWAADVSAHPLGNFSISQYSALRIGKDEIELRYIVDLAEIPTFQEIQQNGIAPAAGAPGVSSYLDAKAAALRDGLRLEVDGKKIPLRLESREILFPEGAGGLPTMKIGAVLKGRFDDFPAGRRELFYRDENFPGRAGWKEVIAGAENGAALVESSVPAEDQSAQLSDYPSDLLNAPPQVLEARLSFAVRAVPTASNESVMSAPFLTSSTIAISNRAAPAVPVGAVVAPQKSKAAESSIEEAAPALRPNRQAPPKGSFTELIATKQLNWSMILFALLVAAALGAFHALEPGHGKTLVAAYLIGSRGTAKHALLLGLIVTTAHTAAVYLLGGIVLYLSAHVVPEKLYPWLTLASGVMIIALGIALFVRRLSEKQARHHHHHHGHDHHHHAHDHHSDGHTHHHAVAPRELLTLGISGGIIPCPAALVVLLSAVSLQRVGFGLLLIVAFSIGLAAVLIAIGLLMVYARQFMARFQGEGQMLTRWLPLTSSAFIVLFGIGLTRQALVSAGFISL